MSEKNTPPVQGTLFEEDFLVRSLGSIAHSADVALTELVANAWDAGASEVRITIPPDYNLDLEVEDDGCGMTPEQFRKRWMTLGYDRTKHQGRKADFPPERQDWRRMAFGRNGVGRHGLLCFADHYEVETYRDGDRHHYLIKRPHKRVPVIDNFCTAQRFLQRRSVSDGHRPPLQHNDCGAHGLSRHSHATAEVTRPTNN
jgi:hypothetical protein